MKSQLTRPKNVLSLLGIGLGIVYLFYVNFIHSMHFVYANIVKIKWKFSDKIKTFTATGNADNILKRILVYVMTTAEIF